MLPIEEPLIKLCETFAPAEERESSKQLIKSSRPILIEALQEAKLEKRFAKISSFSDTAVRQLNEMQLYLTLIRQNEKLSDLSEKVEKIAGRFMGDLALTRFKELYGALSEDQERLLKEALSQDADLRERLAEIGVKRFTDPSQQLRQLRDMQLYLTLFKGSLSEEERRKLRALSETKQEQQIWKTPLDQIERLLNEAIPKAALPPVPSILNTHQGTALDDRIFAHIHAEALLIGSNLEGHSDQVVIHYLKEYLERHPDPQLTKMLRDADALATAFDKNRNVLSVRDFEERHAAFHATLTKIIQELKPGEKTLLPSGWTGTVTGHSTKISLEREEGGTLRLILYNTGDGTEFHATLFEEGELLIQPFIEVTSIDEKRLLDSDFTKALLELKLMDRQLGDRNETRFSAEDLYGIVQNGLGGKVILCRGEREKFMPPQASGTCTWSSLLAVLHTQLSAIEYDRITCDIACDSLCAYFQKVKGAFSDEQRLLLQHAAKQTAKTALDAFQSGAIPLARLQEIHATLKELQEVLKKAEGEALFGKFSHKEPDFTLPKPTEIDVFASKWLAIPKVNKEQAKEAPVAEAAPSTPFSFDWLDHPEQLLDGLKRLNHYLRSDAGDGKALEQFFFLQPTKDPIWDQLPEEHSEEMLVQMADLSELLLFKFRKGFDERSSLLYAHYLTAFSLEFMKGFTFKYGDYQDKVLGHFNILTEDQNLYRPEERHLRANSLAILKKYKPPDIGGPKYTCLNIGESEREFRYDIPKENRHSWDNTFDMELMERYLKPEAIAKLEALHPSFKKRLSSKELQIALALCDWYGDVLPPHICALRRIAAVADLLNQNVILEGSRFQSTVIEDHTSFGIKLNGKSGREHAGLRDFEKEDRFKEFVAARGEQNSEKKVMLQPLNEWQRALKLILTGEEERSCPEQQLFKTVAYFSENLEQLSELDLCLLCRYLLFEGNYIETLLDKNPALSALFHQFFERGYRHFTERKEIEVAAFFIEIGGDLDAILRFKGIESPFPDFRERIKALLSQNDLSREEKTALYLQLAASYESHPPDVFSEEDARQLVTALLYPKVFPSKRTTEYCHQQAERARARWQGNIKKLTDTKDIVKVFTENPNGRLNLETLELFIEDHLLTGLPPIIVEQTEFKNLFAKTDYSCRIASPNCYEFTDERGILTKIELDAGGIDDWGRDVRRNSFQFTDERGYYKCVTISQKLDDKWYQLAFPHHLGSDFQQFPETFRELCKNSSLWIDYEQILVKDHSHQTSHVIELVSWTEMKLSSEEQRPWLHNKIRENKVLFKSVRKSDPPLTLVELQPSLLKALFEKGMVWQDKDGLKLLELPSMGLSFEMKKGQAVCQQFPGFYLASHQHYRGLESVKGAIVLENRAGKRKLFLPYGTVEPEKGSLTTELKIKNNRSLSFDLDNLSRPIASQKEQQLYLATLLLGQKQYEQAQKLLRASLSLVVPYTTREIEQLRQICQMPLSCKDNSPHAAALTLTALTLLPEGTFNEEEQEPFRELYQTYKQQMRVIPELALTSDEEAAILEKLKITEQRIHGSKTDKSDTSLNFESSKSIVMQMVTRPHMTHAKFLELYELALKDPVKLELSLVGAKPAMAAFLRGIGRYPSPPPVSEIKLMREQGHRFQEFKELQKKAMDLGRPGKKIVAVPFKSEAPRKIKKGGQRIGKRSEMAPSINPVPDRIPLLKDLTVFKEEKNQRLKLEPDEISVLQNAVGDELKGHIATYWQLPELQEKWHRLENPETAKTLLLVEQAERMKIVRRMEHELLQFANALPKDVQRALLFETEKIGGLQRKLTLQDMLLFSARAGHFTIKEAPEKELLEMSLSYLDAKAQLQQLGRALTYLTAFEESRDPRHSEACYKELTRNRPYKAHENPELLVFEVLEEIGLHDWQVKDLQRMLSPTSKENPNIILEKVMGSGKSKVYLPILALGKADGEHIPFVVVHSSEYESVAKNMQIKSGQIFAQVAHPLQFTRDSDTSLESLQKILDACESVRANRHFFVVTDKSMHNLSLVFDELWYKYLSSEKEDPALAARIERMGKILKLFQEKGKAIFDEADLLLNCRYEVVYALGDAVPIAVDHTHVVADLYERIDPYLAKLSPFTRGRYEELKPAMIKAFVEKEGAKDPAKVSDYLQGGREGAEYVNTLPKRARDRLAIALYEFRELLPIVLDKRCGEHYGYSDQPDKILPVPFVGNGSPSPTAEFSFPYSILDYTVETLKSEGISAPLLKSIIRDMQRRAEKERKTDPTLHIHDTQGYQDFLKLCAGKAIPFLKVQDSDIAGLVNVYRDKELYTFAKTYLFPAVALHDRKISSTPYTLATLFKEVQGFTGTPWNRKTYPNKLETIRDIHSAGKTQGIIWKNSQKVHLLSSQEALRSILKQGGYHAFLDVGALFLGRDNQQVAEDFLKSVPPEIKGILFFKDNRPYVLERGKAPILFEQCALKKEELFLYYDQLNTTGKDFKIAGKSLLSVGKNSKMRDLEQGYMRDREAELGPRVEFVLPSETEKYIKSELKVDHVGTAEILTALEVNQEREIKDQLLMATFGRLKEAIHSQVKAQFLNVPPPILRQQREKWLSLIGEPLIDDPHVQLGRYPVEMATQDFFAEVIAETVKRVAPLTLDEKELWRCIDLEHLPKTLSSASQRTPDSCVEQQSQTQLQQQSLAMTQKEQLSDQESGERLTPLYWFWDSNLSTAQGSFYRLVSPQEINPEDLPKISRRDIKTKGQPPFLRVADIFAAEPALKDFANIFDIETSYNFMPAKGRNRAKEIIHTAPFENGQLLVQQFLICKERATGKVQVRLLSQADAGFFFQKLAADRASQGKVEVEATLYHPTLGVLQSNSEIEEKFDAETVRKIVQAKFYNGESLYTPAELIQLKAWINEKGKERMQKLFCDHILPLKREKQAEFAGSVLQKILMHTETK